MRIKIIYGINIGYYFANNDHKIVNYLDKKQIMGIQLDIINSVSNIFNLSDISSFEQKFSKTQLNDEFDIYINFLKEQFKLSDMDIREINAYQRQLFCITEAI